MSAHHGYLDLAGRLAGRSGALALLAFGALASAPRPAHAYSDPERFSADSTGGGGGGRYFTGSPVDGFACKVCHDSKDAPTPTVSVRGLPVDGGYVPGTVYDVEVSWPPGTPSVGIQLEMVGRDGSGAGLLSLPDETTLAASCHCGGLADEAVASYLVNDGSRTIVGVRSCDAGSLRFRFTAPNTADVAFAGGLVTSDDSATAAGDGFVSLNRVLYRAGEAKPSSSGGCSVAGAANGRSQRSSMPLAACFTLGLAAWLVRRRHAR
jgi:hypothetical protein